MTCSRGAKMCTKWIHARGQEKRPFLRKSKHVLFHEAVKHDRTGQPIVETGATRTRSSEESKSFNDEDKAAHGGTGQPVGSCHTKKCQTIPTHVLLMKAQAATLETKQFMIERDNPL